MSILLDGDSGLAVPLYLNLRRIRQLFLADFYYAGDRWRIGHWPVCCWAGGLVPNT